jgi:hypothetical protein
VRRRAVRIGENQQPIERGFRACVRVIRSQFG